MSIKIGECDLILYKTNSCIVEAKLCRYINHLIDIEIFDGNILNTSEHLWRTWKTSEFIILGQNLQSKKKPIVLLIRYKVVFIQTHRLGNLINIISKDLKPWPLFWRKVGTRKCYFTNISTAFKMQLVDMVDDKIKTKTTCGYGIYYLQFYIYYEINESVKRKR